MTPRFIELAGTIPTMIAGAGMVLPLFLVTPAITCAAGRKWYVKQDSCSGKRARFRDVMPSWVRWPHITARRTGRSVW